MYSDETDFCRRIKLAGWEIRHLPQMTIFHHDGKAGVKPNIEILSAYNRMVYARKFFSPAHRQAYAGAVILRHLLRSIYAGGGETGRQKRAANRLVIAAMFGRAPVPYESITCKLSVVPAAPELRERSSYRLDASRT
jgi:GT2 family glycosyltransferase